MLCILAFIIFLILFPILGFFPEYRRLFSRSWQCVFKKATFQPCDINLGEELKNKLLGKFIFKYPRIVKFLDKTFSFWAFLFVVLNIWSLVYAANAGLNLFVYDTCDPTSGEGCALSGDSCSVGVETLTFLQAFEQEKLGEWAQQPFKQFGDTVSRIPDRLKTWKAEDYLSQKPSFYKQKDGNPMALEIIDPGCPSCRQLWRNIKQTDFADRYNLSYLVYPIPNKDSFRFNNSFFIAKNLESLKEFPKTNSQGTPSDWQLLDRIFTQTIEGGDLQFMFSSVWGAESDEAKAQMRRLLGEIGYDENEISQIENFRESPEVKDRIEHQKNIVEDKIKTIKIPTILFDNRRYDRVVEVDQLR